MIPAGVFQPSGEAPWNWPNDFDLWRCMLREYAEELLGADEDHDSEQDPIDYAAWPFAARMTALREAAAFRPGASASGSTRCRPSPPTC